MAKAAKSALITCCSVINNPDIAPVVPAMITAIKDPDQCPAALEELMHTTFVHPVDASSLSIIVPILARSLVSRGAMHEKRKAATVVVNMCKLVLNPSDVEPFVPKLLPELRKSAEDAAFEEIRGVSGGGGGGGGVLFRNSATCSLPRTRHHTPHTPPTRAHSLSKPPTVSPYSINPVVFYGCCPAAQVCAHAEKTLLRAMGEAGIAEINEKSRKEQEKAELEGGEEDRCAAAGDGE